MFAYYLELALRSLKRSPGLTILMVLSIGFGVAASMTTYSVFRAVSGDPIPWKSSQLFVPQIDMWGPTGRGDDGEPPVAMDYTDAMKLMRDHRAKLQSAMYQVSPSIVPADASKHPINVSGHAVYSEFFPMLDVPFKYGNGWSADDDEQRAAVVVISSKLNEKLFGGANSVGKTVNVEGKDYRVVGVTNDWNPQPRFYDVVNSGGFSTGLDDVFLPFERAIALSIPNDGNTNCNAIPAESGFVGLQHSSCVWIAYMAELDDAATASTYKAYLDGYAHQQQQSGRFAWAPNNRLRNLPDWLDSQHVVPSDTKVSLLVALGLLIVCLVNTAGLLLAKFLRRSSEIGVRRALGAQRLSIYAQFLTEAGMIGLAGGVLGLLLTGVGVASVGWVLPKDIAALARVDLMLLAMTLLIAVVATLLAGLYPTFRAARVQPAWQLKSN
ncbi:MULTISPECIES: ABC transporter permease [unclassified Rhodanobacter]|jgi:putative ABC transport system permease protein|uniref:ABC transporter permease n=1 Tax=unclassified Rhodanobacter TaxID=2621553 RepID=UPI0016188A25|nr:MULTISPECIES: ABC transporter permease [unclassified Rhodanobacter]MBB6242837.1 putative ABC transport system permease protein [Rhodanobacter sp. MP1X3]MBB6245374.1 putative ABC transport system permease protein [Rhodanobacter sp. A1T4]